MKPTIKLMMSIRCYFLRRLYRLPNGPSVFTRRMITVLTPLPLVRAFFFAIVLVVVPGQISPFKQAKLSPLTSGSSPSARMGNFAHIKRIQYV